MNHKSEGIARSFGTLTQTHIDHITFFYGFFDIEKSNLSINIFKGSILPLLYKLPTSSEQKIPVAYQEATHNI